MQLRPTAGSVHSGRTINKTEQQHRHGKKRDGREKGRRRPFSGAICIWCQSDGGANPLAPQTAAASMWGMGLMPTPGDGEMNDSVRFLQRRRANGTPCQRAQGSLRCPPLLPIPPRQMDKRYVRPGRAASCLRWRSRAAIWLCPNDPRASQQRRIALRLNARQLVVLWPLW